jgi:hypothetical protein
MSNPELETLAEAQLARAHGGVSMKLTQYGYHNDPYMDSETRRASPQASFCADVHATIAVDRQR